MRTNENKEKGKMYEMYGNYVQVPYSWYGLCRKYTIPKEIVVIKGKKNNTIELNPMEINVLAYLANFDECYVSNGMLSETFNVGVSTIEKYLKELRWTGLIKTFEDKDTPVHTRKRMIHVQHANIKEILSSKNNPYICMVGKENNPYECMGEPIQTNGTTHTDVLQNPSTCMTNKKELERYKKDIKEELAVAQTDASEKLEEEKRELVIECFQKGMSYKKDKPEIQKATGLNGKAIHTIIQEYYEEMKENENKTCIPLANGMMSNCYIEDFNVRKESLPNLYHRFIGSGDDDYNFKKEFVDEWLLRDYGYVHNYA